MSRHLLDLGSYDVVVVGSGSAGSTAAISAARNGARTLLLEKRPFLGGVSTAVLDTFYGVYTPGTRATKVVGGVADEVVAGPGWPASTPRWWSTRAVTRTCATSPGWATSWPASGSRPRR